MRIIAGTWRGRRLAALGKGDAGAHLRPTADRVRESLFSMLAGGRFGDPLSGARVLDLFAGSGALGFEALSRAAATATFVENGRKAQALIRQNTAALDAADRVRLIGHDATRLGPGQAHDLVFLDPPYAKGLGEKALGAALTGGWIAPDALIVWEESAEVAAPMGIEVLESRRYGDTKVTIFQAAG